MKRRNILPFILGSTIPLAFAILFSMDLYDVFFVGGYPFGTDKAGRYSIYSSKGIYVTSNIIVIIIAVAMIFTAFKAKWKWYFSLFVLLLFAVFYNGFPGE